MNSIQSNLSGFPESKSCAWSAIGTLVLFLVSTPAFAGVDRCEALVSKRLTDLKLGTFDYPSADKTSIETDSCHSSTCGYLRNKKIPFDRIVQFGSAKDPDLRVFMNGGRMVGFESKEPEGPIFLEFSSSGCDVEEIIKYWEKAGYMYITADLCHVLPTQAALVAEITEADPNGYIQNCTEQGGTIEENSKTCVCKGGSSDGKYINPWFETCAEKRRPHKETAREKFESFVRSKGGLFGSNHNQAAYTQAIELCRAHANELTPKSGEASPVTAPATAPVEKSSSK